MNYKIFNIENENIMEVFINTHDKIAIFIKDKQVPNSEYLTQFITLDKEDAKVLIQELNRLIKII